MKIGKYLKYNNNLKVESNFFNEEIKNIALISNDDKRMQSINSIETYAQKGKNKQVIIIETIPECLTLMMS